MADLSISVNKCCVLNVGRNECGVNIGINGAVIPVIESTRDL